MKDLAEDQLAPACTISWMQRESDIVAPSRTVPGGRYFMKLGVDGVRPAIMVWAENVPRMPEHVLVPDVDSGWSICEAVEAANQLHNPGAA